MLVLLRLEVDMEPNSGSNYLSTESIVYIVILDCLRYTEMLRTESRSESSQCREITDESLTGLSCRFEVTSATARHVIKRVASCLTFAFANRGEEDRVIA